MPEPKTTPPTAPKPVARPALALRVLLGLGVLVGATVGLRMARPDARQSSAPSSASDRSADLELLIVDPEGRPVANAELRAQAGNSWSAQTQSNAAGQALLRKCPAEPLLVEITHAGLARLRLSARPGEPKRRIELPWGGTLAGKVVDETGQAIADASVLAMGIPEHPSDTTSTEPPWQTTTDASGAFAFDTLSALQVDLDVSQSRHRRTVVRGIAVRGVAEGQGGNEPVTVILQRTAAIAGRITGADNQPAAAANITLAGSGVWPAIQAKSDSTGHFRFDPIPEGVYELRADQPNAVAEPLEGLSVDPGGEAQVELHLIAATALHGRAYDAATGAALAGVVIQLREDGLSAPLHSEHSAADGSFSVGGLRPVTQRLSARLPGFAPIDAWIKPSAEPHPLAFLRAGRIAGHVLDEDGKPVAEASLSVRGLSVTGAPIELSLGALPPSPSPALTDDGTRSADNLGVTHGGVPAIPLAAPAVSTTPAEGAGALAASTFHSDAQGRFELNDVPPGSLHLTASHPSFAPSPATDLTLHAGERIDDLELHVSRGGQLEGRLVDPHEQPIAHVRVELVADGSSAARSRLSAHDGSFQFDAVLGGVHVTAYPYGLPPVRAAAHVAGHATSQLTLVVDSETRTLRGRVLDERGRAIESATVSVRAQSDRTPFALTVLSAPDGSFEAAGLPAPPYVVSADQLQYAPGKPLRISSVDNELTITLQAGGVLRGVVLDTDASDVLAGAHVKLVASWLPAPQTARSDAEGLFEFSRISDGNYAITVESTGFLPQTRTVAVSGARDGSIERAPEAFALIAAGSVSGDVVDRRGVPVWNAEVAAGDPATWSAATRTDHAGHFALHNLAPGETVVRARHAQAGESEATGVHVYAKQEMPGLVLRLPEMLDDSPAPPPPTAAGSDPTSPSPSVASDATGLALGNRNGAVVVEALGKTSAAARAGLHIGDRLVSVDGEPVRSAAQARGMLRLAENGARWLELKRGAELHRVRYQL